MKFNSIFILFILILGLSINSSFAQAPPPDDHGGSGDAPPGGGAPIAGGMVYLVVLGAAYGAKKYAFQSEEELV